MNDQMMNEGFWSVQTNTWLKLALWMEWLRPFLYCLLAIAVVGLLLTLLDLAMLCWKEFHATRAQKPANPRTEAAPVSESRTESVALLKKQSHYAIKVLFLLGFCCSFSQETLAQDQSQALNSAIRDGDHQQVKALLAKGANVGAGLDDRLARQCWNKYHLVTHKENSKCKQMILNSRNL